MALQLGPGVVPLQPFPARLAISGEMAERIEEIQIDFAMTGMDMGINRYRLVRDGSVWNAPVVLPICTVGRSDWIASVAARTADTIYQADFKFRTER